MGKIEIVFRRIHRRSTYLPGPALDRTPNRKPIPVNTSRIKLSVLNTTRVNERVRSSSASERHVKIRNVIRSVKGAHREVIEALL